MLNDILYNSMMSLQILNKSKLYLIFKLIYPILPGALSFKSSRLIRKLQNAKNNKKNKR
jgi:hypothetical protein